MISLRKLERMQDRVLARKLSIIFHDAALGLKRGLPVEKGYLKSLSVLFHDEKERALFDAEGLGRLDALEGRLLAETDDEQLAYILSDLSSLFLTAIGSEPSDWDFTDEHTGKLDGSVRQVADHILVLDRLRSPFNVGSIFRSADSFGIRKIILVEGTAPVTHPHARKSARGTIDTVEHETMSEEQVVAFLQNMPCFALELGGTEIGRFPFPASGACVVGSEEMGVSVALRNVCDRSLGRVTIPLHGSKGSLNVSVATGIMLASWAW